MDNVSVDMAKNLSLMQEVLFSLSGFDVGFKINDLFNLCIAHMT